MVASTRRMEEVAERLACGCTLAHERHDGTCIEHDERLSEKYEREAAERRALACWNGERR